MSERDGTGEPLAYAPPPVGVRAPWYYVAILACSGIFVLGALMFTLRLLSPRFPPPIPLPTTQAAVRTRTPPVPAAVPAAATRPGQASTRPGEAG